MARTPVSTFASIVQQARSESAAEWDESALRRAMLWARSVAKVTFIFEINFVDNKNQR